MPEFYFNGDYNMLSDRDYMRPNQPSRGSWGGKPRRNGNVVMMLLMINAGVFLLQNISPSVTDNFLLYTPAVIKGHQYYRVLTYMFLHGGFMHILMNMWMLFMFGKLLEERIGSAAFLWLYFISGILGGIIYMFFNPEQPCLGASAAVVGVSIGTAMFYPNMKIMLLFPPVPMKLKTFTIVFILLELFLESSGALDNVAHVAHLGGALGGYIYLRIFFRKEIAWDIIPKFGGSKHGAAYEVPSGWTKINSDDHVPQKELDRLLDKISVSGINSLTPEEEETLRRAREQMKRR